MLIVLAVMIDHGVFHGRITLACVLRAWCKFLGVSGEAKLLPVVKQKQLGVFYPTILFFVID